MATHINLKGTAGATTHRCRCMTAFCAKPNQAGFAPADEARLLHTEFERVFDTRDDAALAAHGIDAATLADPTWRDQMRTAGEATTQAFARRLVEAGFDAMLVRSFASGAAPDDLNLVLWRWSDKAPARLVLIDDENRLSR